jgi:putative glutamine amidotransferase
MARYKIGIIGWKTGDNSFGVSVPYLNFIEYFRGQPIILAPQLQDEVDKSLDLVILPGGPDIDTARYTEIPDFNGSKPCQYREHFDNKMLAKYIEADIPLFGICRGFQSLVVHFGGKLIQHMYHETNDSNDRQKLVHNIDIVDTNLNYRSVQGVNSIHHQAVLPESEDALKDAGFEITARYKSTEDKTKIRYESFAEAIHNPKAGIAAVQHHPEEIFDDYSINLVENLLIKATI